MKTTTIVASVALALVAGCASAPKAPVESAPTTTTAAQSTPDWVTSAKQQDGEFDFAPVTSPKAKATALDGAPATNMKMDNASSFDVKNTHLNAAARTPVVLTIDGKN